MKTEENIMEKFRLGRTELMVSRSGFGALPIQRIPMEESDILLRKAYDNGINFFDTTLSLQQNLTPKR